jgi:hypothetical protein
MDREPSLLRDGWLLRCAFGIATAIPTKANAALADLKLEETLG